MRFSLAAFGQQRQNLVGSQNESLTMLVLSAQQFRFQPVRRMALPVRDPSFVFAFQTLEFRLRLLQGHGAFTGLRKHQSHLYEVQGRRKNVGDHIFGDKGLCRRSCAVV